MMPMDFVGRGGAGGGMHGGGAGFAGARPAGMARPGGFGGFAPTARPGGFGGFAGPGRPGFRPSRFRSGFRRRYPGYLAFSGYPGFYASTCQDAYAAWYAAAYGGAAPAVTRAAYQNFLNCLYAAPAYDSLLYWV